MNNKNKGFTLIELLAVIVILGLIMAIAIPAVLQTINQSKRQTFYLYAQSLYSKAISTYTQGMDENDQDTFECAVYDIAKDLNIKNTGDYEGWVRVNREAVSSDTKKSASITINSSSELEYVHYCITKNSDCNPDKTFQISEGDKKVTVTQTISQGQTMCVNYQYGGSGGVLTTSSKQCKSYNDATPIVTSYDYNVVVTFKSRDYAVQNFNINDETTQKEFYEAMDTFKKESKTRYINDALQPMAIQEPTCGVGETGSYKGTTTTKYDDGSKKITTVSKSTVDKSKCPILDDDKKYFNIILNPNGGTGLTNNKIYQCSECGASEQISIPTREGYTFAGWYYDKAFTNMLTGTSSSNVKLSEKIDTQGCVVGYNDVTLYAKWNSNGVETTTKGTYIEDTTDTSETQYTEETTTDTTDVNYTSETSTTKIIDVTDHTILLNSLNISGYPINFSPVNFIYDIVVPYTQTNLSISAIPAVDTTTVTIEGNDELVVGDNIILIKLVSAETGNDSVYRITVSRLDIQGQRVTQPQQPDYGDWTPESGLPDPTLDESNAALKSLMVSGYVIPFNSNVYEYQVDVNSLDDLLLSYKTASKGAIVYVDGNENLKDGDEVILTVQSQNGYYKKKYKIKVHYSGSTSTGSKYLRNIAIVLVVILIATLIITYTNKKTGKSLFKKKEKEDKKENNNTPANEPGNPPQ